MVNRYGKLHECDQYTRRALSLAASQQVLSVRDLHVNRPLSTSLAKSRLMGVGGISILSFSPSVLGPFSSRR